MTSKTLSVSLLLVTLSAITLAVFACTPAEMAAVNKVDPVVTATPANSTPCWDGTTCGPGYGCAPFGTHGCSPSIASGPPDPNDIPTFGKKMRDAGATDAAK